MASERDMVKELDSLADGLPEDEAARLYDCVRNLFVNAYDLGVLSGDSFSSRKLASRREVCIIRKHLSDKYEFYSTVSSS